MMDFLLEMRTEVFAEVMVRYTDLLPNHPVAEVGRSGWIKLGCVSNCLRKGDGCMRFYQTLRRTSVYFWKLSTIKIDCGFSFCLLCIKINVITHLLRSVIQQLKTNFCFQN